MKIYCGPWRSKIKIMDIGSIKSSRNPLSAPACSLDRLEVKGHHIYTLISPKEKDDLIQALLRINPDITIK